MLVRTMVVIVLWGMFAACPARAGAVGGPQTGGTGDGKGFETTIEFAGDQLAIIAFAADDAGYEIRVYDSKGELVRSALAVKSGGSVAVALVAWTPTKTENYRIKMSGRSFAFKTN